MKSFKGCWTCRLRRKKCDERQPVCAACASLLITCYYDQEKPQWMDGGSLQAEMAEHIKREVKARAPFRLREPLAAHISIESLDTTHKASVHQYERPASESASSASSDKRCNLANSYRRRQNGRLSPTSMDDYLSNPSNTTRAHTMEDPCLTSVPNRSDAVLLSHFLDYVFPFVFPCYQPPLSEGGRSWILEFLLCSPVPKQAAVYQSSYFLSLARGTTYQDSTWRAMLTQINQVFEGLREALQIINQADITKHSHGVARMMSCILHWQHFEIALLGFENWQTHLNATTELFEGLIKTTEITDPPCPRSSLRAILNRLGPPTTVPSVKDLETPAAEQSSFRFSTTLLLFDDIIASTVLHRPPRLFGYHRSLLDSSDVFPAVIDFESVLGCQNFALLHIGEIASLDAWKSECKAAGNLDMMELVNRATRIKSALELGLTHNENSRSQTSTTKNTTELHSYGLESGHNDRLLADQRPFITRVWAHAGLLYLSIVVSGWQSANPTVRHHVEQVIELLSTHFSQPTVIRTLMWPFCVAGCLAQPSSQPSFRALANSLQPPTLFRTALKALDIMEQMWRTNETGDSTSHNLADCFKSEDMSILLV